MFQGFGAEGVKYLTTRWQQHTMGLFGCDLAEIAARDLPAEVGGPPVRRRGRLTGRGIGEDLTFLGAVSQHLAGITESEGC